MTAPEKYGYRTDGVHLVLIKVIRTAYVDWLEAKSELGWNERHLLMDALTRLMLERDGPARADLRAYARAVIFRITGDHLYAPQLTGEHE